MSRLVFNQRAVDMAQHTLRAHDGMKILPVAKRMKRKPDLLTLGDPCVAGNIIPHPGLLRNIAREFTNIADGRVALGGYTNANGYPPLVDLLSKRLKIPDSHLKVTAGSSSAVRTIFQVLFGNRRNKNVVIPELSYVSYFAESVLSGAKVRKVALDSFGKPKIDDLDRAINQNTELVVIIPVGNPFANPLSSQELLELVLLINQRQEDLGKHIFLAIDTAYVRFMETGDLADKLRGILREKIGGTILLETYSKIWAFSGGRLGYMGLIWNDSKFVKPEIKDQFITEVDNTLRILLTFVPTPVQAGLYCTLFEEEIDRDAFIDTMDYERNLRVTVQERLKAFVEGAMNIRHGNVRLVAHPYYRQSNLPEVPFIENIWDVDFGKIPHIYSVLGLEGVENLTGLSLGGAIGLWQLKNTDFNPLVTTPLTAFGATKGDWLRFVPLAEDADRVRILEGLNAFVERASKGPIRPEDLATL